MDGEDRLDIVALKAALEAANEDRRLHVIIMEDEERHDDDGNYRYGSERTYWDLVQALLRVHEDVETEAEANDDPILVIQPGENLDMATARIEKELQRRAGKDPRFEKLVTLWGDCIDTASTRFMKFSARQRAAAEAGQPAVSPTVQLAMRQDAGLEDLLPGVDEDT